MMITISMLLTHYIIGRTYIIMNRKEDFNTEGVLLTTLKHMGRYTYIGVNPDQKCGQR
jgi:hypothetical protein